MTPLEAALGFLGLPKIWAALQNIDEDACIAILRYNADGSIRYTYQQMSELLGVSVSVARQRCVTLICHWQAALARFEPKMCISAWQATGGLLVALLDKALAAGIIMPADSVLAGPSGDYVVVGDLAALDEAYGEYVERGSVADWLAIEANQKSYSYKGYAIVSGVLQAPCGCLACEDEVQIGHWACATSPVELREDDKVFRRLSSNRWFWEWLGD